MMHINNKKWNLIDINIFLEEHGLNVISLSKENFINNSKKISCKLSNQLIFLYFLRLYDVSVKSINCVCACTNKQFILIDTPNTENEIKWCKHAILWEFEVFKIAGIA